MGLQKRVEEEKKKQLGTWAVLLVSCVVILSCVSYFVNYEKELKEQEALYEQLRVTEQTESVIIEETEEQIETEEVIYCSPVYDFQELQESNEDIYAWITVPGTLVDYPVLQSEEDNYYLDRNLDHNRGYPGCIYTNACNAKDFSDYNTVLYGHNMKNDSMFGSLHDFEAEKTFAANREIIVYTEEKRLTYEIYAAVKFTDIYITAAYDIYRPVGNEAFLKDLKENVAQYDKISHLWDMEVTSEDKLITLSTCVSNEDTKRYLVVGVLKEVAYYEDGM